MDVVVSLIKASFGLSIRRIKYLIHAWSTKYRLFTEIKTQQDINLRVKLVQDWILIVKYDETATIFVKL